jgi:hypothetical protein
LVVPRGRSKVRVRVVHSPKGLNAIKGKIDFMKPGWLFVLGEYLPEHIIMNENPKVLEELYEQER